jgi:hypothetical protein
MATTPRPLATGRTISLPDPCSMGDFGTRIDWIRFKLGTGFEPGDMAWIDQAPTCGKDPCPCRQRLLAEAEAEQEHPDEVFGFELVACSTPALHKAGRCACSYRPAAPAAQ